MLEDLTPESAEDYCRLVEQRLEQMRYEITGEAFSEWVAENREMLDSWLWREVDG